MNRIYYLMLKGKMVLENLIFISVLNKKTVLGVMQLIWAIKTNTKAWEASASVTPDGKYLFFSRNVGSDNFENVDIFWVDAEVIYALKKE